MLFDDFKHEFEPDDVATHDNYALNWCAGAVDDDLEMLLGHIDRWHRS